MRALHVWIGLGVVCTFLGAGLEGPRVLGQLPLIYPPPGNTVPDVVPRPVTPQEQQSAPAVPGQEVQVAPPPADKAPDFVQPGQELIAGPGTAQLPSNPGTETDRSAGPLLSAKDARPGKLDTSVTTEWIGPANAKLGQPMPCQIVIHNNGLAPVHNVVVRHTLPEGVEYRGSDPAALVSGRVLSWNLGTMEAGQTRKIGVQLVASVRGSLNCYATVTFASASALNVQVREPLLAVKVKGPEKVVFGEEVIFTIFLSNPGDGPTDNVKVKALLPEGLEHAHGRTLEMNSAGLAPREMRTMQLVCMAKGSGAVQATIMATAESNLKASDVARVEILTPRLELAVAGPKLRYIDRHAVYALKITNAGSAPVSSVVITEVIPPGFKFHQTTGSGRFDDNTRTVSWFVGDLQPGQAREISLDLVAAAAGDHKLICLVNSARGIKTEAEVRTRVEGLSKLEIDLADTEDPVEVGAETCYEIRVINSGTKTETNLKLVCTLPEQMEFVSAKNGANLHCNVQGRNVIFDPLAQLAPRGDVIFRVRVKGTAPGNLRFRAEVSADNSDPIMREESTRVYNDDSPAR